VTGLLGAPEGAIAVVMGSGETVTYGQLEDRSCRLAQRWWADGLRPGDHVALMMENHPRCFEVTWAALRSGLRITPINWHLTADEAGYIIDDCDATALVTSAKLAGVVAAAGSALDRVTSRLVADGDVPGFDRYENALAASPAERLEREVTGSWMFYSSGTTGRPKGIVHPVQEKPFGEVDQGLTLMLQGLFGFGSDSVYLSPAPLYHAAPIGWSIAVQRLGGTVVVMEKFDAEEVLELIERHRVTHAQFVPTHFIRLLKLPETVRTARDVSSLRAVIHAAAPCPVEVKSAMMDWLGPIVHEYYAGSEGNGFCYASPADWLAHPGTVGRSLLGPIHILDEDGTEQPVGEPGQIWFESGVSFEYHHDAAKTRESVNDKGWSSLGDIGTLDADGFLYLSDRVSHMIISGGVNIYPQEVENALAVHPAVADVAVIGVPDPEMGEQVKAVVELLDPDDASDELGAELIAYCRERLAAYKCPRSVDFVGELPRLPTGKLRKRDLRARYWPGAA
jgi:acyl-CoA synthetase (AMP-forming)/AMP-acid ligase II